MAGVVGRPGVKPKAVLVAGIDGSRAVLRLAPWQLDGGLCGCLSVRSSVFFFWLFMGPNGSHSRLLVKRDEPSRALGKQSGGCF